MDWWQGYYGRLTDDAEALRYMQYYRDLLRLGRVDPRGATVLDAGSGFGFGLLCLGALGAARLRGVEQDDAMVAIVEAYAPALARFPLPPLEIATGSVSALPAEDRSVDIVLSIEAISHYLDVPAFVREAARVLRPGGVLLIADRNNATNPTAVRESHELWAAFETDSEEPQLDGQQLWGRTYPAERRDLIAASFPALEAEVVHELALETSGMTGAEVIDSVRTFVETGRRPGRPYVPGTPAVAPHGMFMEALVNPWELASLAEACGFDAEAYGYWGGAQGRRHVRLANRILTRLSRVLMSTAPSLRVVARRRPD